MVDKGRKQLAPNKAFFFQQRLVTELQRVNVSWKLLYPGYSCNKKLCPFCGALGSNRKRHEARINKRL